MHQLTSLGTAYRPAVIFTAGKACRAYQAKATLTEYRQVHLAMSV